MGILIEGASRAELVRCVICLAIFGRGIPARLGLFASSFSALFIFGVPSFLCLSFSVAGPLLHAARPRLMPVCPLEIDCMASLFLVVALRQDVCCEQGSAQGRSGLLCPQSSAQSKKPLFVGWQLLINRPCCLCFNPLFHRPPGGG